MNFIKWLVLTMVMIAVVIFTLLFHIIQDVGTCIVIASSLSAMYGIITVICELAWRRYNKGPHR